jgi:tRNA(Ile)-lysidine synthase
MRLTLRDRFRVQINGVLVDPWDTGLVVLAVSGGSDSTALMHLAAGSIDRARLHVITVDHGLRGVADEVALVAAQSEALGLKHSVLNWQWDGQGNLQAAARIGRWAAIAQWAADQPADVCCMTGHTHDDQAETVLMRLARGSGVAGLAGMQSVGATPTGLRICRPLLQETRADLRAWLSEHGVTWSDDPSNDDLRFDRVKARGMQDALGELGLTSDRLVQTAAHMQAARREMTDYAAMIAQSHITQSVGDVVFPATWPNHGDVAIRLFRHALHFVGGGVGCGGAGGGDYPPRSDATLSLWQAAQDGQGGTLHGCLVSVEDDHWRISREVAATPAPTSWPNRNRDLRWDNRWLLSEISGANTQGDLTVRALGDAIKDVPNWRDVGLPRRSLMASPAVFEGESLVAAPIAGHQNGFDARIVADFASFLLCR